MTPVLLVVPRLADPPLDPSADEARSLVGTELAKPEYNDVNLAERIQRWIERLFDDGLGAAQDLPPLGTFAAILVLLALAFGIALLVSRARRTAKASAERAPALTGEVVSAAELRARAEAALGAGRYDDALVDAFRALAVRQVERGRIEDLPQATAHELAGALGAEFLGQRTSIDRAADLFDAVLYGDHPATRDQATELLALDDALAGRRERAR
ncbi:DUF4129 domain-containing protein [Nocardioides stalactiti]|uniref:DUF4129 domain-containing protein n=1 Tax=Nocardioides stalactiti TaxID=2755356 RepID=UPI001602F93C|nr:DUF4129 domain-containing protein [Nocardioides stalactiti]